MIDFSRNHFELFGLPARFRFDPAVLDRAYRELQGEVHPDRFATAATTPSSGSRCNRRRGSTRPIARSRIRSQRAHTCCRCTASMRSTRPTPQLPLDFLERQLERREAAAEAAAAATRAALDAIARTKCAPRRASSKQRARARCSTSSGAWDAARRPRARAHVPRQARRRHRRDARGAATTDRH